jgi:hypothetical protein
VTTLESTLTAVRAEARRIDVTKAVLALLLVLPFVLGWLARMAVRGLVWALSFAAASVKVGWQAASPTSRGG